MSVEIRTTPSRVGVGAEINPVANTAGEQIAAEQILDWVLRGYVFTGGSVLVDVGDYVNVTTQADTTPTVVLQSPIGKAKVVIPLRVRCSQTDDGGGKSQVNLVFTKSRQEAATTLAFTAGTALKISNNLTTFPMVEADSTLEYTVTSAALTALDSIVTAQGEMADAGLTTGLIMLDEMFDYSFVNNPVVLTEGAALLLYGFSGSSTGKIRPSFTWAELPRDVYAP